VSASKVAQSVAALQLTGISKRYPGVVALDDVSLEVRPGEVHAIVGENGAGKSTLMSIAAGSVSADTGSLAIGGAEIDEPAPRSTQAAGLALVYQHPALLPDLTVAENMALAMSPGERPKLSRANAWARERLSAMDAEIDPSRRVVELSVEERHLVEICKALALEPNVLILDEPTEPLDSEEIDRLFAKIKQLTVAGTAVVYISHRIPEVQRIADRVTVLRDGHHQGTFAAGELDEDDILQLIVGRDVESAFPGKRSSDAAGDPVMHVEHLSQTGLFDDVSLAVAPGEIVGLGGVTGNGQRDFLRALAGLGAASGDVWVGDRRVRVGSAVRSARAGIAYIPGDRHEEGLFSTLSVRENMTVGALGAVSTGGVVRSGPEREAVDAQIDRLSIRTPSVETRISSLSGGNQQKTLLARALMSAPAVLLAEEPTHGVDIGARLEIYRLLREAAGRGVAVIVLSSDVKELEGLCDRVLIFSRGKVVEEVAGDDVTEDLITRAAVMSTTLRERAARRRAGGFERFAVGDYAPSAILIVALVALSAYTTSVNDRFLLAGNITSILFLLSALAFVSLGQQLVMMTGGIDLSLGPLMGFMVVVASFILNEGVGAGALIGGLALMLVIGTGVGGVNAALVSLRMSPVVATLVTFTMLQGFSLLLRSAPDGPIDQGLTVAIGQLAGTLLPVAFLVAAAAALALEYALKRTHWGVALRAIGSREPTARALGIPVARVRLTAYLGAGMLSFLAAIPLMAQIGVGDPLAGTSYTLSSITAVVLGGASVFGGRGSFVGAFLGAVLTQAALNSIVFLDASDAWQYWIVGGLTLVAAGVYSKTRAVFVAARAGAT
jgi:ribose transport system ATP-binding protein